LWTFLAVLFVALRSVPAAAAETCTGENVLDAMKRDDPAGYEKLMKEAAAYGQWRYAAVSHRQDGHAPSWLFGTMHLTDERVIDLPAKAQAAFDAADTWRSNRPRSSIRPRRKALFSKPELTMFTGEEDLTDYLTDDATRIVLKQGLAERGIQLALVQRMKPWLISGMVALPPCEFDRKQAGAPSST
jgi:uncharacterized protein YbaP (TraB family)